MAIMAGAKSERAIAKFAVNNKESLIKELEIKREEVPSKGITYTLDALHAQTKTVDAIIKSKNNYVIGVKNNQKNLHKQLKETAKMAKT